MHIIGKEYRVVCSKIDEISNTAATPEDKKGKSLKNIRKNLPKHVGKHQNI